MIDLDYRVTRDPLADLGPLQCWFIEKRVPIWGWRFVRHFRIDADAPESEVVEMAMALVHPKTIVLPKP